MYYVINVFQTVLVNVKINVHLISRIRGIGNLYFFLGQICHISNIIDGHID